MLSDTTVKLHEYLTDSCPHRGCKYNVLSICTCEDSDHLENIMDTMDSLPDGKTSVSFNKSFVCYAAHIREGQCTCGSELVEFTGSISYGDTDIDMHGYYCPCCDKE